MQQAAARFDAADHVPGSIWDVSQAAAPTFLGPLLASRRVRQHVTERYSHLAPAFMAEDADRMSLNVQYGLGHLAEMKPRA